MRAGINATSAQSASSFTILELLVVIGIVVLVGGLMLPALGTSSARNLDGTSRQFVGDLENARLTAIAHRTKTRVLIASTNDPTWGQDLSWRAYALVRQDAANAGAWIMEGKINRVSQSVTFDPVQPSPTPSPAPVYLLFTRKGSVTAVERTANSAQVPFTGAYIEFLPTGATSLDPSAGNEVLFFEDGFVPNGGTTPVPKNVGLRSQVTIDPLSGSISLK